MCWKSNKYPNHFNQTNFQPTQLTVPQGSRMGISLSSCAEFPNCHIHKLQMSWFHVPKKWKCDAPYKTPGIHLSGSMYQGEKVIQGIWMIKISRAPFLYYCFHPATMSLCFLAFWINRSSNTTNIWQLIVGAAHQVAARIQELKSSQTNILKMSQMQNDQRE